MAEAGFGDRVSVCPQASAKLSGLAEASVLDESSCTPFSESAYRFAPRKEGAHPAGVSQHQCCGSGEQTVTALRLRSVTDQSGTGRARGADACTRGNSGQPHDSHGPPCVPASKPKKPLQP